MNIFPSCASCEGDHSSHFSSFLVVYFLWMFIMWWKEWERISLWEEPIQSRVNIDVGLEKKPSWEIRKCYYYDGSRFSDKLVANNKSMPEMDCRDKNMSVYECGNPFPVWKYERIEWKNSVRRKVRTFSSSSHLSLSLFPPSAVLYV